MNATQTSLFGPAPVAAAPSGRPYTPILPQIRSKGITRACIDFETTGLRWWRGDRPVGVAVGWEEGDTIRSTYLGTGHAAENLDPDKVRAWMRDELRGVDIVNLNTRFDAHHAREWGVSFEDMGCRLRDVGHYAALLDDHRNTFSLDAIGREFVGEGKAPAPEMRRMAEYSTSQVAAYAEQDARLPLKILRKMEPMLAEQGLAKVAALEDETTYPVMEMERNGCPIDMEKAKAWQKEIRSEVTRIALRLAQDYGVAADTSSGTAAALFRKLGLPITNFTAAGAPSFPDEVLVQYDHHPAVHDLRMLRMASSLDSKFISKYLEGCPDGLMRYSLHQLRNDEGGTISGRFSCSAIFTDRATGTIEGSNIQQVASAKNQKRRMGMDRWIVRELYLPGTGALLSSDARQVEYRLFSHYAQPPGVLAAYAADPLVSYHEVVWDLVKKFTDALDYQQIKNLNFAILYGAGIAKLAAMMGVDEDSAAKFARIYDQAFPEAKGFLRKCSELAKKRGWVKTLTGRRIRFPGAQRLHKALNAVIQGGATGDITKLKLVELHKARKATGFVMRATIHDEVIGDAPDRRCAEQVHAILDSQDVFEQFVPGGLRVPILWETEVGPNWRDLVPPDKYEWRA